VRRRTGEVCAGEQAGDEEVLVHRFSPAREVSGVRGKWAPDFMREKGKLVLWTDKRRRANIIPSKVEWTAAGFASKDGGCLTCECVRALEDWIEVFEAQSAEQETERAASGESDPKDSVPSGKRWKVATAVKRLDALLAPPGPRWPRALRIAPRYAGARNLSRALSSLPEAKSN
jgi:hypothetical protein